MRRSSCWIGWALCLCASLTVSARDYPEDDDMILDVMREDGTQPETGSEPAAAFLRCNKVKMSAWQGKRARNVLKSMYQISLCFICVRTECSII